MRLLDQLTTHAPPGRLQPHESGRGWKVVVEPENPDSPVVLSADGGPLNLEEATMALDALDRRNWAQEERQ